MADKDVRLAAADLLLDRGMRFNFTDAPFIFRLFRLNSIRIRPLTAGAILEISKTIVADDLEGITNAAEANGKIDSIAAIVAVAILNGRLEMRLFKKALTKYLIWQVPAVTLVKIYLIISSVNKVSDFMIITGFFTRQTRAMMNVRIPGQKTTGS